MASAMAPFESSMPAGFLYRLSTVTIAISLTIRQQITVECFRRSSQQGWVNLGRNLGRKGLTDVTPILARSGRDMGLLYTEEIVSISSDV